MLFTCLRQFVLFFCVPLYVFIGCIQHVQKDHNHNCNHISASIPIRDWDPFFRNYGPWGNPVVLEDLKRNLCYPQTRVSGLCFFGAESINLNNIPCKDQHVFDLLSVTDWTNPIGPFLGVFGHMIVSYSMSKLTTVSLLFRDVGTACELCSTSTVSRWGAGACEHITQVQLSLQQQMDVAMQQSIARHKPAKISVCGVDKSV